MSALVHVAVAIIINKKNQVLISLRDKKSHQGGLWEFPGGKVEDKESVDEALKREIKEELGLSVLKISKFKTIKYQYSDKLVLLDVRKVDEFTGKPKGLEGQEVKWIALKELNEKNFPAANSSIIKLLNLSKKYMITGDFSDQDEFKVTLENSLKNGIRLVQLRSKNASNDEYINLLKISEELCKTYGAILLLNTNLDTFLNSKSDGLHLNSQMLSSMTTRSIDDNSLLSVSCHTVEEIEKAKQLKADIILLSPVKKTNSHPEVKGIGWKKFIELSSCINIPIYALGGMTKNDIGDAVNAGAQGVAAISSFWKPQ